MLEFKICTFYIDGNVFTRKVILVLNKVCYGVAIEIVNCVRVCVCV